MQRKGKLTRVSTDLKSVLRAIGKGQPGVHPEIWARWNEIVGANLARRTMPRSLQGKTLFVDVANSAWMQEISFLKPMLIEQLGEAVGENVVREIRLSVNPAMARRPTPEPETNAPPSVLNEDVPSEIKSATDTVRDKTLRETVAKAVHAHWPGRGET